jgi:hypothetical protein
VTQQIKKGNVNNLSAYKFAGELSVLDIMLGYLAIQIMICLIRYLQKSMKRYSSPMDIFPPNSKEKSFCGICQLGTSVAISKYVSLINIISYFVCSENWGFLLISLKIVFEGKLNINSEDGSGIYDSRRSY